MHLNTWSTAVLFWKSVEALGVAYLTLLGPVWALCFLSAHGVRLVTWHFQYCKLELVSCNDRLCSLKLGVKIQEEQGHLVGRIKLNINNQEPVLAKGRPRERLRTSGKAKAELRSKELWDSHFLSTCSSATSVWLVNTDAQIHSFPNHNTCEDFLHLSL